MTRIFDGKKKKKKKKIVKLWRSKLGRVAFQQTSHAKHNVLSK